nr:unnamed protein product [Digitaria exilis]
MAATAAQDHGMPLYKDASAPVQERVRDLLGRMTLREKAAQMAQIERTVVSRRALAELGAGSVLNGGGSAPRECDSPAEWAHMVDGMQRLALSSRLGIPILYGTDAVHGHNNVYGATVFPHNVGLGATRWGRCYEGYSEDTEIVRSLTTIVTGLQGQPPADYPHDYPFLASVRENILACAKHFVGDGGTDNGINEGDTICSYDDLERIHIAPYLDCIAQGVATVMASHSRWHGERLHGSRYLLTDVLKGKLGFKGFVISDWEGIDKLCEPRVSRGSDYRHCILNSVNAGMDMIMIPYKFENFLEDLVFLVETGEIPMSRIDDAVERILRVKFISGVFEHPFSDPSLLDMVGCTSILEAIKESVGVQTEVVYEACATEPTVETGEFSYAVVVVGEVPYSESEGDRTDLSIPFNGSDLITRVASKIPTLVIVVSGRPLDIEAQVLEKIYALVAAWLPGTEGMGIADCLFGHHDFVGTLPVTWHRSVDQLPIHAGDGKYDPLFPVGYGLKMFRSYGNSA